MSRSTSCETVIDVTTPQAAPAWALLERQLLEAQSRACEQFYARYFDQRGYLLCVPRWSGDDGPDDALENVLNWTLLHALGGMMPAVQALVTDRTPANRRGAAFGVLATAQAIGNGGGPVGGSLIAASLGVPAVFIATAPVFLVGAALVARLPSRRS